jgi:hypothetical protein
MQSISENLTKEKAKLSWKIQDSFNITPQMRHKQKLKHAFRLAQEGAALGCKDSMGALARCYFYGNGVMANATIALDLAKESADANSPYGQFVLGRCLQDGQGDENLSKASQQYRLAADQGLAIAQHNLGVMLYFGLGVDEDDDEAEGLWFLAVLQGYKVSYRMLAYKYEKQQSDNPAVAKIYEAAAEMGDANAQLQLGRMYEEGRGVFSDTKKALKLYKSAKLQGLEGADAALVAALTCGECCSKYDRFKRTPLVLPCGCTFCEQCVDKGPRGRASKCPGCLCRVCETAVLPVNEGVRSALGRVNKALPLDRSSKGMTRKQLRRVSQVAAPNRLGIQR